MAGLWRAALAASFLFGAAAAANAQTITVSFVQANDLSQMEGVNGRGGFARLATVINQERAAGHAFFVFPGNAFSPSLMSGIDHGAHIVDLLNQLRVDVFTPGNAEFDFGPDVFRERLAEADFPVLSSNLAQADGSLPANMVQDHWLEVEGIRIAFYGLTTEDTTVISSPGGAFTFANSVSTAVAKAAELRAAGADIVVALAHTPLAVDLTLFRNRAADLILSGHDNHLLTYYDGTVALTEASAQGEYVVVTRLAITRTVDANGAAVVTWVPDFDIVDTAEVAPDPAIAEIVAAYADRLDAELDVAVATTGTLIESRRVALQSRETTMGNLVADAMRLAVNAEVALVNGGAIRGDRLYLPGSEITRRDVFAELPFNNRTLLLEVTGAQLLAALENGFSEIKLNTGRFPQLSGMTVEVNAFAAPGNRVLSVMVGGRPLVQSAVYRLATNDFIAGGGDGYTILRNAPRIIDLSSAGLTTEQVIAYLQEAGTVDVGIEGRIVLH
ncbi:MAG: bifunctional UDP-sugar hydrolase/5'-nucleotidase [Bauldia sp.]